MYKVFIDNKEIVFTKKWKKVPKTLDFALFHLKNTGSFNFVNCRNDLPVGCTMIVKSDDPEAAIRRVFSDYEFVEAVDAGNVARRASRAVSEGRAVAWGTKSFLGELFGESEVALAAVTHPSLAQNIQRCVVLKTAAGSSKA